MPTRRFSTGQANEPSKLDQKFSFTGKLRGADVLRRLVEICGYNVLRRTLDEWEAAEMEKARKASS